MLRNIYTYLHDDTHKKPSILIKEETLSIPLRHTRGAEAWLHSFLTSSLDKDDWSTSRSGHLTPEENPILIEQNAVWNHGGRGVGLCNLEKRKTSFLCQ